MDAISLAVWILTIVLLGVLIFGHIRDWRHRKRCLHAEVRTTVTRTCTVCHTQLSKVSSVA